MTSIESKFDFKTAGASDGAAPRLQRSKSRKTPCKVPARIAGRGLPFTFVLQVSVLDQGAIWDAAAAVLTSAAPSLSPDEISETLGDREAPALADCLTTLLLPPILPGGIIQQVHCSPA